MKKFILIAVVLFELAFSSLALAAAGDSVPTDDEEVIGDTVTAEDGSTFVDIVPEGGLTEEENAALNDIPPDEVDPDPSSQADGTKSILPNTETIAANDTAKAIGVGAKGAKLTNSEPAYEDSTDGLNPKIAAGGYCVGGNCTNLLPVCESFPKGGTGPISVTKYTVGDCISRSNAISLGQQTQGKELDYMANVTKEMGSGAAIIYTISDSMNWQDFYRSSISGAAQRVSNFKCPAPKGSIMVVAPEICPI